MKSGIKDKNGKSINLGDNIGLFYVDPMGKIHNEIDSVRKVIFQHGSFGDMTETRFVPLLNWANIKQGEYIPNKGNVEIITDEYNFIKIKD